MKGRRGLARFLLLVLAGWAAFARSEAAEPWEEEVRAAEDRHRAAFLAKDLRALEDLLASDFVVNSPMSTVASKEEVIELVRNGTITLASFSQQIEQMRRFGDIAVVLGADTVEYTAPAPNAGRTDHRRFTDIWRLEGGRWRFIARHANVLCR